MEIRIYWRVLMRKWWIVIPTLIVTLTATIVSTFTQVPVYETSATFVVTPNTYFENISSFLSGLDTLSRRTEIASTYAEIAISKSIKHSAAAALGLTSEQRNSLSVESQLLAGTNVLEILVQGSDPVLVRDFADTVGSETMTYVKELYEVADLRPLDSAIIPSAPIKPNKLLNLGLGGVLGLVLGVGLAFLSEYLQTPIQDSAQLSVLDGETGVYNKRYFVQRLGEEMSRAKRNRYPLSLALLHVAYPEEVWNSFPARTETLRKVGAFLRQYLRKEDILARYDDKVFAFMLPDMSGEDARGVMEKLLTRMNWTPFEIEASGDVKLSLSSISGVVGYSHNGEGADELLDQANQALQQAGLVDYGHVFLWPGNGGVHQDETSSV